MTFHVNPLSAKPEANSKAISAYLENLMPAMESFVRGEKNLPLWVPGSAMPGLIISMGSTYRYWVIGQVYFSMILED
jgi:hypothetical protein